MIVVWIIIGVVVLVFLLTVLFGAPYVPSLDARVKQAFDELYAVGPTDFLVDIGSGDGRVLREVSRRGGRALGYEINPFLVLIANALSFGNSHVRTKLCDYRTQTLPAETTVVYVFGVSRTIEKIMRWVDEQANAHRTHVYIVSFGFASKNFTPLRRNGTHFLYKVGALQSSDGSV